MKVNLSVSVASVLMLLLASAACSLKNPVDVNRDIQNQLNDTSTKKTHEPNKPIESGGQPGLISVNGAIVQNDTLDSRIAVSVKGGLGKDGLEVPVDTNSQPKFSATNENIDLSGMAGLNTLINMGCSDDFAKQYAERSALQIAPVPGPITNNIFSVQANTILLCHKLDAPKFVMFILNANQIMMDHVTYDLQRIGGSINVNTNRLMLIGPNLIQTTGLGLAVAFSLAPAIELNVLQELKSENAGSLALKSFGSNFRETTKAIHTMTDSTSFGRSQ